MNTIEKLPDDLAPDTRQYPSRFAPEWNDIHWRAKWLGGRTDEELDQMSSMIKGRDLRTYAFNDGYHYYGPPAVYYIKGRETLRKAEIPQDALTVAQVLRLGKVVFPVLEG